MNSHIKLRNDGFSPNHDCLYHIGLSTNTHDLPAMFGNTKVVCMGGTAKRMQALAKELSKELNLDTNNKEPENIIPNSDRYVMYKVGPVVCVNHGIGGPSIGIVLHEVTKLLWHAKCTNVVFFRIGTSGGLGILPGTVVISQECLDPLFRPYKEQLILGKRINRPAKFDESLVKKLQEIASKHPEIPTEAAKTLCTNDFYEEQGRTDGAICEHTEEEKQAFLKEAYAKGIRNIEMETLAFASFSHHLGLRAACLAVVLIDRFKTDQVQENADTLKKWELRVVKILVDFLRHHLSDTNNKKDGKD